MQKSLLRWLMVSVIVLVSSTTYAQEKGQIGLTMAYPASVGVVWHATDRMAIRPEFDFSRSSNKTSGPELTLSLLGVPTTTVTDRESSSLVVSIGFSGLLYMSKSEGLSTYVSPRFSYSRISSDYSDYGLSLVGLSGEPRSSYTVGGSFGAQYAPSRKFSVFGEVGIAHNRYHSRYNSAFGSEVTSESRAISSRAGVGIIFYFGN